MTVLGIELAPAVILLGVITGMTYGILAVGIILIYRSNRIVNFAHAEIGVFAATVLMLLVVRWHVPYWLGFLLALAVGAVVAGITEFAVIRRLRNAPRIMSIVATLGVGQFLLLFALVINNQAVSGFAFPHPTLLPSFLVGPLLVTPAHVGMLVLTPVLVFGLVVFLRRSIFGAAIRAAAANPEAASLAGVGVGRMATLSWVLAGAVSAFTAVLVIPTQGGMVSGESLGPSLLLRALVPAVVARMSSLPIALAAGVSLGIIDQVGLWNYPEGGILELLLFLVVVVSLLLQQDVGDRERERGSWAAVEPWPPLPDALRSLPTIRRLNWIGAAVGIALAIGLWVVVSNAGAVVLISIIAFTLVGLSIFVVTGMAGQLSLGQFAFAAIGAVVSYHVVEATGSFLLGLLYAGLAAAVASVIVGLPALRIQGLMLAVTTLAFALVTQSWLLVQPWAFGSGVNPARPVVAGVTFETARDYFLLALAVLCLGLLFTRNIKTSGIARRLIAVRDNEANARAFTIPVVRVKLEAFALAGFVAGLGGAVYSHALTTVSPQVFLVGASITVAAVAVLGGLGTIIGPLLGTAYLLGVPEFLPLDNAGLAATSVGWLLLILYYPGGLAQVAAPMRDGVINWAARRRGLDVQAIRQAEAMDDGPASMPHPPRIVPRAELRQSRPGTRLLTAQGLEKRFGGVHAVRGVDLEVRAGETLGLIGPNGAGKTTLFELLSGFTKPDRGSILFDSEDIGSLSPEARGRLGLIRSFQDAGLFPTLTVLDTVKLSQERSDPTRIGAALLGLRRQDRAQEQQAEELLALMGLERFKSKQIRELSTGTRRVAELACLIALQPRLLLLDEPSSGIAQRETEALGELLERVKQQLDTTLVIIEHDIPLVMGLADRVIAMESGRVIAVGTPSEVRANPQVIDAYLGGDLTAIERSGSGDQACRATTRNATRCTRKAGPSGLCVQHDRQRVGVQT